MVSINLLDFENSDLPCKEESAAIVHFFFDYVNTTSEHGS